MKQVFPQITGFKILSQYWGLIIAGSVSLAAYGGLVQLHRRAGSLTAGQTPITLGWYTLAFAAYLGVLAWLEWRKTISLPVILAAALLFRGLLLFTVPTLSSDVHRYVWEGYIATQGASPYASPVDSPELDYLAIPQRALIDHAWMASPYLPAGQVLFATVAWLFPLRPLFFQLVMVIIDLGNGILLTQLLRLAKLPAYRSVIYLWNPLVIVEVAHGAHIDAWMIFLTLLALWLIFTGQYPKFSPWLGPIVLALATLTKGAPILLVAILFWRWRWQQIILYGIVMGAIIVPVGLRAGWGLSGPLDGHGLFGALRIFADRWNYNSSLFHWLETYLIGVNPDLANKWAKRIVGAILLATMIGLWVYARQLSQVSHLSAPRGFLRLMAVPFMAYILLSTTVHPWYLLILLAFLPFLPPSGAEARRLWLKVAPWIYLSWAIALSYWTYINPLDLREFKWVRNTEWWPTLVLLAIGSVLAGRRLLKRTEPDD